MVYGKTARKLLLTIILSLVLMPVVLTMSEHYAVVLLGQAGHSLIGVLASVLLIGLLILTLISIRTLDHAERTTLKVNRKLSESQYNLDLAQSYGGVGSWKWGLASDELLLSDQFKKLHGITAPETTPVELASLTHPDDVDDLLDKVQQSIDSGKEFQAVHRVVMQSGDVRWIEKRGNVLRDDSGNAIEMYGVAMDVTARVTADRQLEEAHARFERIAAKTPGMVFQLAITADGEMQFPYVSHGIEAIFGISPEVAMTVPGRLLSMVHPDDKQEFYRSIEESQLSLADYFWLGRVITARGELKWVQILSRPTKLPDGTTSWDGIATDVTESRLAQAALEETRDKLDFLINESP
ncbi:MAG: PAS domain-containing protein, partial [Nitrospira sp.]|nr:PAS domain-containing protein [Nitrospira sp.]